MMPLGTNAVFALWTLVNSRVDDEPAEFWPMEPDELRERVTGRDVTALDRALKREDVRDIDLLPRGKLEELAAFNVEVARILGMRKPSIKRCARTLLDLLGSTPLQTFLARFELVSAADHCLLLFDATEIGDVGYRACMRIGRGLSPHYS